MSVCLNDTYVKPFITDNEYEYMRAQVALAHGTLMSRKGAGNEFLGWLDLPRDYDREEFDRIKAAAARIRSSCEVLVVIGIGGSYLGARAAIEYLKSPLYNNLKKDTPDIYFAGCNISASYMQELLSICEGRDICVNVISKSGTTTEPAVAFRVFRELLEKKYGVAGAKERIFVTTDRARGALKGFADQMGYESFVVPDDIGGRFSVLSAVGLLPIAVAGVSIDAQMAGAARAREELADHDLLRNDCYRYAALRNLFFRRGKNTELLVGYEPFLPMLAEWWKQLFGESEGKEHKGIFPASAIFSTDLHSLGQYIQDGGRHLFETVLWVKECGARLPIPHDPADMDGLNFLAGKDLSFVNEMAKEGTLCAHVDGGVPNILLEIADRSEETLGYLFYFFEKACAISGYLLGVNPFDQPGVEAYKANMFALLGKPGYEAQRAALQKNAGHNGKPCA